MIAYQVSSAMNLSKLVFFYPVFFLFVCTKQLKTTQRVAKNGGKTSFTNKVMCQKGPIIRKGSMVFVYRIYEYKVI